MGPHVTSGHYYPPGPTHGHYLYNNRPAIIFIDSGLTPEVVPWSSPHGDVMEVGDTVYHASSGMVKHTRVVSSPLVSNMAGIMPLQ